MITVSAPKPDGIQVVIDSLAYAVKHSKPLSIWGPNQLRKIGSPAVVAKWKKVAPAVARLRFMDTFGREMTCTSFLITSDVLMTNNHCVANPASFESLIGEFDYDNAAAKVIRVRASELLATDFKLDYSLLRLKREMKDRMPLRLSGSMTLADHQGLAIIQHPGGEPKQISFEDCFVQPPLTDGRAPGAIVDFGHLCDTLGGSSGSPVFLASSDDPPLVVGLHHLGFRDKSNPPIMINQGVYMQLILQDIRVKCPTVAKLIEEMSLSGRDGSPHHHQSSQSTAEAIADWHYWVAQGYCF